MHYDVRSKRMRQGKTTIQMVRDVRDVRARPPMTIGLILEEMIFLDSCAYSSICSDLLISVCTAIRAPLPGQIDLFAAYLVCTHRTIHRIPYYNNRFDEKASSFLSLFFSPSSSFFRDRTVFLRYFKVICISKDFI